MQMQIKRANAGDVAKGDDMPLHVTKPRLSNQSVHGCEQNGVPVLFRRGVKLFGLRFMLPTTRRSFLRGFIAHEFIAMPKDMNPQHAPPFIDVNVIYADGPICYLAKKGRENA